MGRGYNKDKKWQGDNGYSGHSAGLQDKLWKGAWSPRSRGQVPWKDPTWDQGPTAAFPAFDSKLGTGETRDDAGRPSEASDGPAPTRTVQAALNAARRAEQRVERLSKDEQTTHAQWDAYVKAMKQSYVKEKKEQAEALDQLEVAREAFRSIVVDAPMSGAPQDGGSTPGPALVDPYMAMAMMQQGHLPFPPTLTAWGLTVDGRRAS